MFVCTTHDPLLLHHRHNELISPGMYLKWTGEVWIITSCQDTHADMWWCEILKAVMLECKDGEENSLFWRSSIIWSVFTLNWLIIVKSNNKPKWNSKNLLNLCRKWDPAGYVRHDTNLQRATSFGVGLGVDFVKINHEFSWLISA